MTVSYLLVTLVAMFGHAEDFLATSLLSRPLVLGPLVGAVLGDITQGIVIGASLEAIFMGNIKVGAAIPPDVITGGVLGTAFAILSGQGAAVALALAVPISILAEMLISSLFIFRSAFNKKFAEAADAGDFERFQRLHIGSGLLKPLLMGVVVYLSLELGAGVMKSFLETIPPWVNKGLHVAGNMLPALGIALLMNVMFNKKLAPWFFLGFLLASFLQLPMIAVAALGVVLALIVSNFSGSSDSLQEEGEGDNGVPARETSFSSADIRSIFYRSFTLEANFNFETCQNTGFAYSLMRILKKIYPTRERMALALKRHLQFFNTSPYGSTLILGIAAAMEEENSRSKDFDDESINNVKLALMGPVAGIFDSLFWGTLKVIAAGVGVSLAMSGSILGPLLFIMLFNVPHFLVRYQLTFIGYRQGHRFLQRISGSNVMDKLTSGAAIVGLMVVGAMPALLMSVSTPLAVASGVSLQGALDKILPHIIPLGFTLITYQLLKRQVKTTYLLLALLAAGFIGSVLNILA
ncbi:PTS system mannose/fructose/sorbose family transporter subunit IID [Chryseolinea sp. T2]|uniref:PTS system mannose/fructose/sorbose family transporter subunit IID n=1 Tax=Chryseolinea sp. T2 TaxID=3129255 RepID=UPI0030781351